MFYTKLFERHLFISWEILSLHFRGLFLLVGEFLRREEAED